MLYFSTIGLLKQPKASNIKGLKQIKGKRWYIKADNLIFIIISLKSIKY